MPGINGSVHELALSRAVVDAVLRHCENRRVATVRLRVGALRQVVPESLSFNFEIVARGTACEGAHLEQQRVAGRLRCDRCQREWDPAPQPAAEAGALIPLPRFRCPGCGRGEAAVIAGEELEVESIEVMEAECTARE